MDVVSKEDTHDVETARLVTYTGLTGSKLVHSVAHFALYSPSYPFSCIYPLNQLTSLLREAGRELVSHVLLKCTNRLVVMLVSKEETVKMVLQLLPPGTLLTFDLIH